MGDWGQIVLVFLRGMPAVILAIFVLIVAYAPIDGLDAFRQQYWMWVGVAKAFAAAVIIGNLIWMFWKRVEANVSENQGAKNQLRQQKLKIKNDVSEFNSLEPGSQFLLLDLFFSGQGRSWLRLDDPDVMLLRSRKYLTNAVRFEPVDQNEPGRFMKLSKKSLELIHSDEQGFRKRWMEMRK